MAGIILKPEWHEGFDKIFMGSPGHGTTHYANASPSPQNRVHPQTPARRPEGCPSQAEARVEIPSSQKF